VFSQHNYSCCNRLNVFNLKPNFSWPLAIFVAVVLLICSNCVAYGQLTGNFTTQPALSNWVKIDSPIEGQQVPVGEDLLISGISSDNASQDCSVSVIANNIKPYQDALASGVLGTNDYSKWSYTLSSNYTELKEGSNRITAKLSCPEPTRWYSVNVIGFQSGQTNVNISSSTSAPSVLNATNDSTIMLPPSIPSDQLTTSPSSETSPVSTGKLMSITFDILNNPVPRGNDQNVTISVSDAASNKQIANATITGLLLYPGGNYVKEFAGTTGDDGRFVYHWTIGEDGDIGELTIQAKVEALDYEPQVSTSTFQITED
jgi:hypothetical protein